MRNNATRKHKTHNAEGDFYKSYCIVSTNSFSLQSRLVLGLGAKDNFGP